LFYDKLERNYYYCFLEFVISFFYQGIHQKEVNIQPSYT